jgi:hypothetical protein
MRHCLHIGSFCGTPSSLGLHRVHGQGADGVDAKLIRLFVRHHVTPPRRLLVFLRDKRFPLQRCLVVVLVFI